MGLQVETEGAVQMPHVWERTDKGVPCYALISPERHGKRSSSTVGRKGRRGRRAQNLPDGVTKEGGSEALPT